VPANLRITAPLSNAYSMNGSDLLLNGMQSAISGADWEVLLDVNDVIDAFFDNDGPQPALLLHI
jgi:hypothetical protein